LKQHNYARRAPTPKNNTISIKQNKQHALLELSTNFDFKSRSKKEKTKTTTNKPRETNNTTLQYPTTSPRVSGWLQTIDSVLISPT